MHTMLMQSTLTPLLKLPECTRRVMLSETEQTLFSAGKVEVAESTRDTSHLSLAHGFEQMRAAKRPRSAVSEFELTKDSRADQELRQAKQRLLTFLKVLDITAPWSRFQFLPNEEMLRRMTASHLKLIVGEAAHTKYQSELFQYIRTVPGPALQSLKNIVWITNRQQGKTSTISKFLAVLSLLSPHGGNLVCVYSTSLDRAQEVTRAAKKYLYYYATDPEVKLKFKELGLGEIKFTTDNERTYTLRSLSAPVANTIQARPKNPESCRGDAPASCLFDEVAFVSESFWFNFAYPLLQVTGRIFLLTTTPAALGSFFDVFSKSVQKQNRENNLFFYLINHSLVCERCWEKNEPARCSHLLYLIPPWKSILRFHNLKRLVPSKQQENFETEVYGAIRRQSSSYFPEKLCNGVFGPKRRLSLNRFEMSSTPIIYISVDPPSHQTSCMGLASMLYSTVGQVLVIGMSEVQIKSCDTVQIQMIVTAFCEKTILYLLESRKISVGSIKCIPIVETNNNDILSLSITKTIRQVCGSYGCKNVMPFKKQYFSTGISDSIGVLTTHSSKHASVQALYGLMLDNRIVLADRFVVVGAVHLRQFTTPSREATAEVLQSSLTAFHTDEKGYLTGKTANNNDDMALAILLGVYWSHTLKAVSGLESDILMES